LRNKKTAVKLVLGNQEPIENVVLVNYTQSKTAPTNGFEYVLSFKKIAVGHIEVRPINTTTLIKSESTVNLVNNPVDKARTDKTEGKHNLGGFKEIVYDLKTLNNSLIEAIK
jgi:hypothetical protein